MYIYIMHYINFFLSYSIKKIDFSFSESFIYNKSDVNSLFKNFLFTVVFSQSNDLKSVARFSDK